MALILKMVVCATLTASVGADDQATSGPSSRLLHQFDFNERFNGNLEDWPKYWTPFDGTEFPKFAEGGFDDAVGHDDPPSLRLTCNGRNVAFRYAGPDTPVSPLGNYVVTGWIRCAELRHARAALSAYYIDADRLPIAHTQLFSKLVSDRGDEWQAVEVFLRAGPPEARTIGLTAWVVQENVWQTAPTSNRHIAHFDVHGRAWFDDIQVHHLPNLTLKISDGEASDGQHGSLVARVADSDMSSLRAQLTILDIDARNILTREMGPAVGHMERTTILPLESLGQGMFRARLEVFDAELEIASRSLQFAVIDSAAFDAADPRFLAPAFGIVLNPADRSDPLTELSMLKRLRAGALKIPVWSGSADVPDLADAPVNTDRLLYELLKARVRITGVLVGSPSDLARAAGAFPRSLLSLIEDDPAAWGPHLRRVVAPYSSVLRSWQVGPDADAVVVADPRLPAAVQLIRDEMANLTTAAQLTIPASAMWEPVQPSDAVDEVCLTLGSHVSPSQFMHHVREYRKVGWPVDSVFVETPASDGVLSRSVWRDWCKRLLRARQSGARTVYVSQPWRSRARPDGVITETDPEYVLLGTLTHLFGDANSGQPVYIAPGVSAVAFHSGLHSTLALWNDDVGEVGRDEQIQLGGAKRQFDMWGRSSPLRRSEDGRHIVRLNADPIYIDRVDRWLIEFHSALKLSPSRLVPSINSLAVELHIFNPHSMAVTGTAHPEFPDGWEARPRHVDFSLAPNETRSFSFELRIDRAATAGEKIVNVRFDLNAGDAYALVVPIEVHLGPSDLDAWGMAFYEGNKLVVSHTVTNRSETNLNFRTYAIAPGRPRQNRIIKDLAPGRGATVEYVFNSAADLSGRPIRLQAREINGARLHNVEVTAE